MDEKGEPMLKIPYGQDPYSVIGKYIREHITAIEDIIAVIEIDGIITNQLFMVDMKEENYFIWNNDWYEGEKDVALIDFFPVSEAINPSEQPEPCEDAVRKNMSDLISRQDAIDAIERNSCNTQRAIEAVNALPSAQPETSTEIQEILDYLDTTLHPIVSPDNWHVYAELHDMVSMLPSAQPETHEIGYSECANSMLKMWIDNVLTDGEYSHIMDKLNAYWAERRTDERTD